MNSSVAADAAGTAITVPFLREVLFCRTSFCVTPMLENILKEYAIYSMYFRRF